MYTRNRVAWWILACVLGAGACSAPGLDPRSIAATQEAQTEAISPADTNQPLAGASPARVPMATPTVSLGKTPAGTEAVPSVAPTAGVVDPTPVVAANPPETSVPVPEAEAGEFTPKVAEPGPGPTEEQLTLLSSLENFGPAPELHTETWLNSEPLTLADLRGKVVMVKFWTFG